MPVIDETTTHLALQLPHPSNPLEDDVLRLRSAINAIDAQFLALDTLLDSDDVALNTVQEIVDVLKDNVGIVFDHVGSGGTAHDDATGSVAGFMSAADKTKLDGVSLGVAYDSVSVLAGAIGQTEFTITGGYTVGAIEALLDGIELDSADYTATDGSTITLAAGTESASSKLKVRRFKQVLMA